MVKRYFMAVFCFVSMIIFAGTAESKSFRIESVTILATVHPDGSMTIQESRTYRFKGRFRWADYRLPIEGFADVKDFRLRDGDRTYVNDTSEEPGTFQIDKWKSEFYVKWFYRARNERRTFVLDYTVTDVVKRYPDVAELYYKFVGDGWDQSSKNVQATVVLPQGATRDEIRAWAHGPLAGYVRIVDATNVELGVARLPRNQFWEGRILFPSRLVADLALADANPQLDRITEQEGRWAREANEARELARQEREARNEAWLNWSLIFAAITIAAVWYWWGIYKQHGRAYPVRAQAEYYSDIPTNLPPAVVSYFVNNRQISGGALLATVFDLARRGVLRVEETKVTKKSFFGEKEATDYVLELDRDAIASGSVAIEPFEQEVLDYLFLELDGRTDRISMKTLSKSQSKTLKWFGKWKKSVAALAKEQGFYDLESRREMRAGLVPAIGLLLVGIAALFLAGPGAILPLFAGLVLLIVTLATTRVAKPYAQQHSQWKALKRYLKKYDFRPGEGSSLADRLDSYLIYGMVLGLSSDRIRELVGLVPSEQHATIFPWYAYYGSGHGVPFGEGFGDAISSMVAATSSSLSSATGTGGGASVGGGGGGGGSGGGAG